eukprot:440709_1
MHKLASFLQRSSTKENTTSASGSVHEHDESMSTFEHNHHRNLSLTKQEEFHKLVLQYVHSTVDINHNDMYSDETLNVLKWFIKQSQITSSIGKDLKLYLKKSLPLFASVYHKYHAQIMHYYHFSFITTTANRVSLLPRVDDESLSIANHDDAMSFKLLGAISRSTVDFINFFYDLLTRSKLKISLANEMEPIVTDLLSVIVALTHMSLTNIDKNIWNDINLSLKLFTGICNHLPVQTVTIFQEHQSIPCWTIWCNFIQFMIQNADKQPKMWILSQRLLKMMLVLTESDCNTVATIFIQHKLLHHLKDIFDVLLDKTKASNVSHKIQHLICCIIHRILEIINVLLHSTTQSNAIHSLCQDLGFWKSTKIYLIRIIPIINITENKARSQSAYSILACASPTKTKRKFVSVHDWMQVFQRLIAVSIVNGCIDSNTPNTSRKASIDNIDDYTRSLSHSLMNAIVPRSHYNSVFKSQTRSNKIKQNNILTQHIIPIFIAIIQNYNRKQILLMEILNHLKALLCAHDANWQIFIRFNYFDQLFASYPVNKNYQYIQSQLFQVLQLCIMRYIHHHNGDQHNDLYVLLLRFMKELQSKVFASVVPLHSIQFIEFCTKCIQTHSYFAHILYDLKVIKDVVYKLLTNDHIPKIKLHLHMPIISPHMSPRNSVNDDDHEPISPITLNAEEMQFVFHFLCSITEHHTANCIELGLNGICVLLSLLQNAKYHEQIFNITSKVLHTLNLQEDDKATFAYYCHGIVILLTRILQDPQTSVLSKIFVMKYLQSIAQQYKQTQHSFCIIDGFSTVLQCLDCQYSKPYMNHTDGDHPMKELQLIYVQECMLTLLSMARDEPNLSKLLLESQTFIEQFKSQIHSLCDREDAPSRQWMVQWILWIALDFIPNTNTQPFRITLSADFEHYTIQSMTKADDSSSQLYALPLQFPITRQFYYPRFAVIALDLLVQCTPKFQQFGLCLFQNFVKRHLNRNRLASVQFIQTLARHIGIWLHVFVFENHEHNPAKSRDKELTQLSLIPDYIFLLSIVGTASTNSDIKTILSLYEISHDITEKQMQKKPLSDRIRQRYPYDALICDTLLKILHNENHESLIEFEHNYNGYSYFELGDMAVMQTECTLSMMLQITVLDPLQPIHVWTLKTSKTSYYRCMLNATEMVICIGNQESKSFQKIPLQKIGISVGIWQYFSFVFNANHNKNRYKLNKSNQLCLDVLLNGELKESIHLSSASCVSPTNSSCFIIGRHENDAAMSEAEWKLANLQLFDKALKPSAVSKLYHKKLRLNVDRLVYREDASMDLVYSLSPQTNDKHNLINLVNEARINCNGDLSICECKSLSQTLLEMGGIPILFDIIESSLTTYALNRILELIGELMEENNANNKSLLLMPLMAVSSHCNCIHVFAYSLKKVVHLADASTVSILFRLCGFHQDCKRGMIANKLQRTIFEAVFLDNKTLKIWNAKNVAAATYQYVYKCLCNLVTVHDEKDTLMDYLSNSSCMLNQIISQIDDDDASIQFVNPAIDLLKCLLLKSNRLTQIKLVMDTIIGMKVSADGAGSKSNQCIIRKNKVNVLLKMLLDMECFHSSTTKPQKSVISLKMIVSLLQSPLYMDGKICDNKQDLLTAEYVLLLATSIFNKDRNDQGAILLKLRDSGTIMAFVESLKPFTACAWASNDTSIIIILLHILVGKQIKYKQFAHIRQTFINSHPSSIIETICKDVKHITLPEVFIIMLRSNNRANRDGDKQGSPWMDNIAMICKQILVRIKNWGTGCTLALVLDMSQAIYKLSIHDIDGANGSSALDNMECLQFFVNKAIRQLLKTQDDLEWFFVEILYTSVSSATQTQLIHFHTMFLQSLFIHITKYISYKTLKQNVALSVNLPLLFKIVCGCFLSSTFMNTSLLLDTIITFINRYSETGKIPFELFKIFNKMCICILSQMLVKIKSPDLYDALNIILRNKKVVLSANNKEEEFFVSLTYALYKIYNTSAQSTRSLCMKIWEYLLLSQQPILQRLLIIYPIGSDNETDVDVYRDGFCKHLLEGEYDEFETWLRDNQVLMEDVFSRKCVDIFNDEVTHLDHEFAILSTSPINNKRRNSTLIQCKNINKIRMNRFKRHELRLVNNRSRQNIAYQSVIYASNHLKYELKMFNFVSKCNHSVFRKPKWSRNPIYGSYHKYPPRLKFYPLSINDAIKSPKIWPKQSQIPSISVRHKSIRRGTILSQFHELLDSPPAVTQRRSLDDKSLKRHKRLLSIKNPDSVDLKKLKAVKSPKVIYGHFKDFSKNLMAKKRRKRSASLSDLSLSPSKSYSLTYREANSAEALQQRQNTLQFFKDYSTTTQLRTFSTSALRFDGSLETIQALRKRVVGLSEKVEFEFQCLRIYAMAELRGAIVATPNFLYLIQNDSIYDCDDEKEELEAEDSVQEIEHYRIDWNDIQKVYLRRYIHQEMGIEVIARRGMHFFLILQHDSRQTLYEHILSKCALREYESLHVGERMNSGLLCSAKCVCKMKKKKNAGLKCMQTLWLNGLVTNFDYLLYLNEYSGRSFMDVTQYPIFPWVLREYSSSQLDLNDDANYRDLSVPMGALNKERSLKYQEQFNEWEGRSYHYGTHYSNPAGIFHYLLRIHPYTQQHVELQNGRFDHSDRLFHDLGEMYLHQSKKSFHAVRELCPEFFYFSSFLVNGACYELGKREHDGIAVNNVILPDWCHNNAQIFIEMHRRALESSHVSSHLHEWIDLIFGYKQQGKHAKESQNLFHPLTYSTNFDIGSFGDDILKQAAIEQVRSFGQAPAQLFSAPHPQKQCNQMTRNIIYHSVNKLYQIKVQIYDATAREFVPIDIHQHQLQPQRHAIGSIWCNSLADSSQYVALLGSQQFVQTPIVDFVVRYAVADASLRLIYKEHEHILHDLHSSVISCVAISSDGQTVITGGADGLLRVWEVKFYQTSDDNNEEISAQRGDSELVAIDASNNISLRFELISSTPTHLAPIQKIAVSQELNVIISVSDCTAIIWDLIHLKVIHILKFAQHIGSVSLQQHRFVISYGSNICVYSIYGEKMASFEPSKKHNSNNCITELLLPNQSGIILRNTKISVNGRQRRKQHGSSCCSLSSSPPVEEEEEEEEKEEKNKKKEYYTSCHVLSGHRNGMIR